VNRRREVYMKKFSLVFFKKDCMGCHACEVACKQEHGLGVGPRLIRVEESSPVYTPIHCHHCAKAPCKEVCPVEAISRNDQGAVLIDGRLCIGCRECVEACPFGAMNFDDDRGIAVKCDMCVDRLAENLRPACASVCPTQCIFCGDIQEVPARLAQAHGSTRA
jgi:Fe-S-cluster-containing dehydrogenase component